MCVTSVYACKLIGMGEENIMLLQTLDQNWKNTDVNMSTTLL